MTHAMLRRAAELSPHASAIHSRYWSAIQARADLSDSAKRAEIEADLARFLAGREADPAFLYPAVSAYATMKQADKVRALQERILNEFPTRRQAELVAYDRLTLRDGRELTDTAAARREHRRLVREYLARPYHYWKSGLGTIYLDHLYDVRSDSTTSDSALLAAIRGTVKYNRINPHITHYDLPLLLADRKLDLALATTLANESLDRWKTQLDGMTSYATAGEMIDRRTTVTAQKYDMLGWIAFHKGQLAEAEKQLERAREMSNQNSLNYYHLGRVAEARGNAIQAEQHFARGYQLETSGFARRTENAKELKRLYAARHASLDGFDTYVERLKEEDRGRRRTKIANARIKDPKDVPPFSLERLSLDSAATAARVSSSSLRGKIVVVNFWGTWCGPCVGEMPELQKFHDRFKNDSNVVFLTVDYNDDKKTVKDWMLQRKFTMPVLLDDGYVRDRAKINAYPTTWFIDQDGKIAFMHVGASEVVLEEFTWRVEMLKGTNAVP
jgi:thiol-disulfide isomerase/thioredoxin